MNQTEFAGVKAGNYVFTLYKGHIVRMEVLTIYDHGNQCRNVTLRVPNSNLAILRHMYNIYCDPVFIEEV